MHAHTEKEKSKHKLKNKYQHRYAAHIRTNIYIAFSHRLAVFMHPHIANENVLFGNPIRWRRPSIEKVQG